MTTWKQAEREVAAILGGERIPVSGRARGDAPDIRHDRLSIEVKHRRTLPAWLLGALEQAEASAGDGQTPIVVLHQHRQRYADALVLMRLDSVSRLLDNGTNGAIKCE